MNQIKEESYGGSRSSKEIWKDPCRLNCRSTKQTKVRKVFGTRTLSVCSSRSRCFQPVDSGSDILEFMKRVGISLSNGSGTSLKQVTINIGFNDYLLYQFIFYLTLHISHVISIVIVYLLYQLY